MIKGEAQVSREPQILSKMGQLDNNICDILELVITLSKRLECITREVPVAESGNTKEAMPLVPLAQRIDAAVSTSRTIKSKLEYLVDNIEV